MGEFTAFVVVFEAEPLRSPRKRFLMADSMPENEPPAGCSQENALKFPSSMRGGLGKSSPFASCSSFLHLIYPTVLPSQNNRATVGKIVSLVYGTVPKPFGGFFLLAAIPDDEF